MEEIPYRGIDDCGPRNSSSSVSRAVEIGSVASASFVVCYIILATGSNPIQDSVFILQSLGVECTKKGGSALDIARPWLAGHTDVGGLSTAWPSCGAVIPLRRPGTVACGTTRTPR